MFGGVAFELLSERSRLAARLPLELLRFCPEDMASHVVADVAVALHEDPSLYQESDRDRYSNAIRFRVLADGAIEIVAATMRARLRRIGNKRYALSARLASNRDAMLALLRGVAAAIVHREGGLVLHAAGAVIDGRAVLFVGPSGAGKSTAVRLTKTSHCFADDHVAIVCGPQGWLAWGLPGGRPANVPLADQVVYPLAAILRVRQALSGVTHVSELDRIQALFALRESVEWADESPDAEHVYLQAACALSSQIAVRSITTVLGSFTDAALRSLIGKAEQRKASA